MNIMMSQMVCRATLCLMLITIIWSQKVQGHDCKSGWFGSNCQYKCHCKRTTSDAEGLCPDGDCEGGWFGPGCQYKDLVYEYSTGHTQLWLYDDDNNTCNNNNYLQEITINLTTLLSFTWLRVQVQDPSLLQEFQVTFLTSKSSQVSLGCKNARNATVDERTLDVHCDLDVTVQYVILKGEGVKSLCSLYISGGRNVALRQSTSQSSTKSKKYLAENAVDGNTDNEWDHGSCTATTDDDRRPSLRVTFTREMAINRYVLYNSRNNKNLLNGFTITSFTKDFVAVMNYTDRLSARDVYLIAIAELKSPISVVQIARRSVTSQPHLVLCEVELYGDSVCPPSKYGRECQYTCNCAVKNEICFVSTGGCPSGCSPGFQGEGCNQPRDLGTYDEGYNSTYRQLTTLPYSNQGYNSTYSQVTTLPYTNQGYNSTYSQVTTLPYSNEPATTANNSESSYNHIDGTYVHNNQIGDQTTKHNDVIMNAQAFRVAIVAVVIAALAVLIMVVLSSAVLYRIRNFPRITNQLTAMDNIYYNPLDEAICENQTEK